MNSNIILVGNIDANFTRYLKSNDLSYEECRSFSEFRPLLKKAHTNLIFLFDKLSQDNHILALKDATLFGGICYLLNVIACDDSHVSLNDTLGSAEAVFDFSKDKDSFISFCNDVAHART